MKMTLAKKVYLGVGLLALVLIGLAGFSQFSISRTKAALIENQQYPELQTILDERTLDHYKWVEGLAVGTMLFGKEFTGKIDHTQCNLGKWYYAHTPHKELEAAFKTIEEPHRRLHATAPRIIQAVKDGKMDVAKKIYQEETVPALQATQGALAETRAGAKELMHRNVQAMETTQDRLASTAWAVYLGLLGLMLAGSIIFLAKPIKKNLGLLSGMFERMRDGDLTARAEVTSRDEVADLAEAANAMASQMQSTLTQVQQASQQTATAAQQLTAVVEELTTASQQLAAGGEELSSGAQEQASSLEETAASLEEITSTVKQNADNARQANQMAVSARDGAEQGGAVVKQAVASMEAISESSKQIAAILTTIDEIAFQTNLLALNAAVEAARAGEQGRGFAVVASEVRALAQRSASASKEIKVLITDSVAKVEDGAQLVNQAGATLTGIVTGSAKVADLIAEIAAASQEQSQGIEQVNKAVTQMDSVTQQNTAQTEELSTTAQNLASQTEELSATAQSLAAQAEELSAQVAQFKLADQVASRRQPAAVPQAPAKVVPFAPKPKPAVKSVAKPVPPKARPAPAATGTDGVSAGFEEF